MTEIEKLKAENERLKILLYNTVCMILEDNECYDEPNERKVRILDNIGCTESELLEFGIEVPNYDEECEIEYSSNNPWDAPGMSISDFYDFPVGL